MEQDDSHGGSDIGDAKHLAFALIMEACRNPAMRLWIDDSEAGNKNRDEFHCSALSDRPQSLARPDQSSGDETHHHTEMGFG